VHEAGGEPDGEQGDDPRRGPGAPLAARPAVIPSKSPMRASGVCRVSVATPGSTSIRAIISATVSAPNAAPMITPRYGASRGTSANHRYAYE